MKRYFTFIFICLSILVVTSCSPTQSNPSVKAVENYLTALVNKDSASLSSLSCADWEASAQLEFDSLQAVATKIEDLKCSVIGNEGDFSVVNCKGKIIATYNNEDQEIDLSVRNYQVLRQGNDYLVCGYQ